MEQPRRNWSYLQEIQSKVIIAELRQKICIQSLACNLHMASTSILNKRNYLYLAGEKERCIERYKSRWFARILSCYQYSPAGPFKTIVATFIHSHIGCFRGKNIISLKKIHYKHRYYRCLCKWIGKNLRFKNLNREK